MITEEHIYFFVIYKVGTSLNFKTQSAKAVECTNCIYIEG